MIATREQLLHLVGTLAKMTRANGCTAEEEDAARAIAAKLRAAHSELLADAPRGLVYTPAARPTPPTRHQTAVAPAQRVLPPEEATKVVREVECERVREERRFWHAVERRRVQEDREWHRLTASRESWW